MVIFGKKLSQNLIKIYTKTHLIAQFKNISRGSLPLNPPPPHSTALLRNMQISKPE